jgi:hypothetical protein
MQINPSKLLLVLLVSISIFVLTHCASRNSLIPGATSGKYIEVFFLSENSNQYFVRPIEWKVQGFSLSIDFTIRKHNTAQPNDPVTFSYTLEKNTPFNDEPMLYFILNDTIAVAPSMVESLVSEDNNTYVKYTSQIEYGGFVKMISAGRVEIIILDGMKDWRIGMPKKYYKAADEVRKLLNIQKG